MRGFIALLLSLGSVLLPAAASAEVIVTVVDGSQLDDRDPQPERPVHVGDRVPLSACGAQLWVGIRPSTNPPDGQDTRVRLAKRRLPGHDCEVEVLSIEERPSRRHESSATSGTSNDPNAGADHWPVAARPDDPRGVPCGTQLIEIRNGPRGGHSSSVNGRQPSDICSTPDDELNGALLVSLIDASAPSRLGLEGRPIPEPSP